MTIYDITQYAPHVLAALCFVAMIGLKGPTVQKPSTWHTTLFIVMAFSMFNILMTPFYDYFMSSDRLAELGGSFEDMDSRAYKIWMMGHAYVYSFVAGLDFFTAILIRKFAQRGRRAIALVMAGFIFVNVMTLTEILTASIGLSELNMLGLNVSNLIHNIYNVYAELIAGMNILQATIIIGAFSEWNIRNISNLFRGVLSFMRGDDNTGGVHIRVSDLCYHGPSERL